MLAIKSLSLSSSVPFYALLCDAANETLEWQIHFIRNIPENRGQFQEALLFTLVMAPHPSSGGCFPAPSAQGLFCRV